MEQALLALQDGTVFRGISVGAPGRTIGEVVTAMTAMTARHQKPRKASTIRLIDSYAELVCNVASTR